MRASSEWWRCDRIWDRKIWAPAGSADQDPGRTHRMRGGEVGQLQDCFYHQIGETAMITMDMAMGFVVHIYFYIRCGGGTGNAHPPMKK